MASAEIRARYAQVDTSNVADVLDTLGLGEQSLAPDFQPFPASAGKLAGWAYTIRGRMLPYELGAGDPRKMDACAGLQSGEISVWSGNGVGVCYFGELIARGMLERGARGSILDGGIRDVKWIGEMDFPVYARYRTPTQSIGRWKVEAWQCEVTLPGATSAAVTVAPGDFILGDEDGVIVVPQRLIVDVLEKAEVLTVREREIRAEIGKGLSLSDALKKFGHV